MKDVFVDEPKTGRQIFFPDSGRAFWIVSFELNKGDYEEFEEVTPCLYVVKMTKKQLLMLADRIYANVKDSKLFSKDIKSFYEIIQNFDDDLIYRVVSSED